MNSAVGNRRAFLRVVCGVSLACIAGRAQPLIAATPGCVEPGEPTHKQIEGPYFKPRSPLRASLIEPGMRGIPLVVSGVVLTRQCQPVTNALLDFWQADDDGAYDLEGQRLRGHQFSDSSGRYRLETIVPGVYPGRTRHIHVKVQARDGPVLTTQLYLPNEPRNGRDFLFDPALVMSLETAEGRKAGRFDFAI